MSGRRRGWHPDWNRPTQIIWASAGFMTAGQASVYRVDEVVEARRRLLPSTLEDR
jgi:hypothetical protein